MIKPAGEKGGGRPRIAPKIAPKRAVPIKKRRRSAARKKKGGAEAPPKRATRTTQGLIEIVQAGRKTLRGLRPGRELKRCLRPLQPPSVGVFQTTNFVL